MTAVHHPMDHPARAPLWAALIGLVGAITLMLSPAGAGSRPVSIGLRTRIRRALRAAEGELRRLILPDAEALLPALPKTRRLPGKDQRRPRPAPRAPSRRDPFRFRLHEPAEDRSTAAGDTARRRAAHLVDDPYGLARVSAVAELNRLAGLITTIEAPEPAIRRLALILRRRSNAPAGPGAPARPRLPFRTDWRPPGNLDLTPPPKGPPGPPDPWEDQAEWPPPGPGAHPPHARATPA